MHVFRLLSAAIFLLLANVLHAETVVIAKNIAYHPNARIQQNVRNECTALGTKLASFTQKFAKSNGITVELVDTIDINANGDVLELYIDEAVSSGNAFIGHRKYVAVVGTLYRDGKKISTFQGGRNSMGGAFAGYKGSCSVLGRCTKALGKDVANWLKNPVDHATLGDG